MIDEVFGASGLLSKKFAGYAPRKGQVDMAAAVERAIAKKNHLIVEGPTGTGKGLSYLVPSIMHAALPAAKDSRSQGRVIVVTANIALQEQLIGKDLPMLAEVLGFPFSFALAKGRNNYLCADSLSKTLGEGILEKRDPLFDRLMAWAQSTSSGDVSEFPETPPPALWKKLSTTSDECKGTSCKYNKQCFAEKAKREVQTAQIVVTNYHLFFAHLLVREKMRSIQEAGGDVSLDVVLPPADVVVFDEAHKAADIGRDFLGFQLSIGQVDWLVRGFNHELAQQARLEAQSFFAAVLAHRRSRAYRARLKVGHPLDGEPLARVLDRVSKFYRDSIVAAAWDPDEKAELDLRARRGATIAAQVRQAMAPAATPDVVYFVEETERGGAILKSKPIDVGPWLKKELFGQFGTVVLTSATLATGTGTSGNFSFVKKELGLEAADELVAESPFSFEDNVLLVVPKTMCMPDERERFPDAVAEHVSQAAHAANGRTLGLFTSYKNLEASYRRLGGFRHRVLKQGDAPRMRLVGQFKEDVSSVLLGVESFWAGVDVPGESLSCVVIDRLPFPTPDDPIVDAISERDDRWFFNYAIPRALIQLKQGFGRLIRTTTDRGCVVVLDRRLVEKGYGRAFLAALPRVKMSDQVSDVARFLEEKKP